MLWAFNGWWRQKSTSGRNLRVSLPDYVREVRDGRYLRITLSIASIVASASLKLWASSC